MEDLLITMRKLLLAVLILILILFMLNIKASTRQGINFQWHTLKIPLYLKVLNFIDRHYNYKELVKQITSGAKNDQEKVMVIFKWTHENIRRAPEGFPIVDDHVWHIIVRGYGSDDQISDVFTTLCNYAGTDAFFRWIEEGENKSLLPLSFVKIKRRWSVFDPYRGVYFKNNKGDLASVEDIVKGDWLIANTDSPGSAYINYAQYFKNLQLIKGMWLTRANTQSPLNRFKFEIKKWLNKRDENHIKK